MILEKILPFREKEIVTKCACCGSEKVLAKTISSKEFINLPVYLDGFKKGMETEYFETRFTYCDKCNNFGTENLQSLLFKEFNTPTIQKVINSEKDKVEKVFIMFNIIFDNINSLTELYWYYDFNKPSSKELIDTRKELIKRYERKLKSKEDEMYCRLMLIDLYRRDGNFKKAQKYINMWPNRTTVHDMQILNKQLELCIAKDNSRH